VNLAAAEDALLVFFTVMFTDPALASCVPVTAAVNEVALLYVVANAVDPHITVEPLRKPVPVTARLKAADPATALVGLKEPIAGALTVNLYAADEALLVFFTVTFTDPAVASCVLVTAAVNEVALLYVVARAVDPHITVDPLRKPVPVTARLNGADPATALDGLKDPAVGALTVNLYAAEEALLVFFTVRFTDPAAASCVLVTAADSEVALL